MKEKFFSVVGFQLITAVIYFVSLPILYKFMGAAEFAVFNLSLTILVLLNYFNLGVPQYIFSIIGRSENHNRVYEEISGGIIINFCIGLLLSIFLLFSQNTLIPSGPTSYGYREWLIFVIPIIMVLLVIRSTLEGFADFKNASILRAYLNSSFLIVPIGWVLGLNDTVVISIHIFILLSMIIFFTQNYRSSIRSKIRQLDLRIYYQILKGGMPFFIISISSVILYYSDRYILPYFTDLVILGSYLIVYDTLVRESIIFGALSQIIYTELKKVKKNKIFLELKLFLHPILISHSIFLISLIILINPLARFANLEPTMLMTIIMLIWSGLYGNIICTIFGKSLIFIGKEKTYSNIFLIESIFLGPILVYLLYKYGVIGAAFFFFLRSNIESIWVLIKCNFSMYDIFKLYRHIIVCIFISLIIHYLSISFYISMLGQSLFLLIVTSLLFYYLLQAYKKLNSGITYN